MGLTAKNIAEYFLMKTNNETGEFLSNMKIQKLVYYAQGFHLAKYDSRLFNEEIEAWPYGPVIRSIYDEYKKYHSGAVKPPENGIDIKKYTKEIRELLEDIWDVYGQYSAFKLSEFTHQEKPWKEAFNKRAGSTISEETMKAYFKTQLV